MTQTEDSGSAAPKQPDTLCILLPMGLWFELPDTWANRRGAMIVLRGLRRRDGWPLVTYEHLAHALGYADRRNVHNFWAEFEACGADLAAFFQRRKKVDAEVVAHCEQIWQAHPLWSCAQVLTEFRRRWPEQGAQLSEQNIRTAGHQVGFLGVQQVLRRQLAEGDVHYQEPMLLEALWEMAHAGAQAQAAEALPVHPLPERLAVVSPSGAGQEPMAAPTDASIAALEDTLLHGEVSPSKLAQLWAGPTGAMLLAFLLYYHGVSLEVIGRFFDVHKTTVMRWLSPLAQLNWQAAVHQGRRFFSGTVAVDEKWLKIAGLWWYLFVAVDHVSGLPLHVTLLPSNATPSCALFLLQLKALGYHPKVIITDGWDAYVQAIARVFPHAQHLLCRFHALRAAFRRLRAHVPSGQARRLWTEKLTGLFRTPSKRTVRRRLDRLQAETHGSPTQAVVARLLAKLPQLLPAVGSTWRPTTSNAAERFLGAFERFYRAKGPFQNLASAQKHVALFMLGYVFETFSAEASAARQGRCPLQVAGYEVGAIPLFHVLNRPNPARLRHAIAAGYALAA
ncbi:MAG: DDE domain-containing protein [Planctomycetaceae bacterium]|nr:MAG: DDE domain-containing protein [Planctomycetaceae bacterium]